MSDRVKIIEANRKAAQLALVELSSAVGAGLVVGVNFQWNQWGTRLVLMYTQDPDTESQPIKMVVHDCNTGHERHG